MGIAILAPASGLLCGLYHLARSVVRYRRGDEDARGVLESAVAVIVAPLTGWQLMDMGDVAAVGYPLLCVALTGLVHYGQRKSARLEAPPDRGQLPRQ